MVLLAAKRELAESVIGTGEGWIGDLSDDELTDLVSLRALSYGPSLASGDDEAPVAHLRGHVVGTGLGARPRGSCPARHQPVAPRPHLRPRGSVSDLTVEAGGARR